MSSPRTVLITGGNSGIGKETAVALAGLGDRVLITARDPEKGGRALEEIRARSGSERVEVVPLDLAGFASVRECARGVLERTDRLDVLVLNAGAWIGSRHDTEEGIELTFGANHVGHFLLTDLLAERLAESAPARVVVVASEAHRGAIGGLPDDVADPRRYVGFLAYCRSKLANVLYARELARRWADRDVTANSLHPGYVRTQFGLDGDTRWTGRLGARLGRPFSIDAVQGAATSIYLASAPEVAGRSGEYWVRCKPRRPARPGRDAAAAARLWERTAALIAARS